MSVRSALTPIRSLQAALHYSTKSTGFSQLENRACFQPMHGEKPRLRSSAKSVSGKPQQNTVLHGASTDLRKVRESVCFK